MPQGSNAQYVAYQYEKLLPRIEELMQGDTTLFEKIEKRNVESQSSRAVAGGLRPVGQALLRQKRWLAAIAETARRGYAFAMQPGILQDL